MSNMKISYRDWNPRLDNGDKTLQQVLDTLPANNPEDISSLVRLFENPKSPISFNHGDFKRHFCY